MGQLNKANGYSGAKNSAKSGDVIYYHRLSKGSPEISMQVARGNGIRSGGMHGGGGGGGVRHRSAHRKYRQEESEESEPWGRLIKRFTQVKIILYIMTKRNPESSRKHGLEAPIPV